ncbi:MAG: NifU family protein [Clostridiales bacterium]|nr:NifU family protein [Clostridiales bacterium]
MAEISLEEIEKVLDEKVRPELAYHNGDIRVEKLEKGVLHVRMTGNCNNCPSAELTLENIVDTALTEAFPELEEIVLVTGVSDGMIENMKQILKMRKSN